MLNFKEINVILKDEVVKTSLLIDNGKIVSIGKTCDMDGLSLPDLYIGPGFIDQHMHGAVGYDTMDGNGAVLEISKYLPSEGVTSFVPTTMTQSFENIEKALDFVYKNKDKAQGAIILGVHMEGPFISPKMKGAQKENHIIPISLDKFKKWNKNNIVKEITVAPELEGSVEFYKYLKQRNIILTMGHSSATYEQCKKLIDLGCKNYTHGFNAMTPFHHRDIGMVGSFLLNDGMKVELICDTFHVSIPAIKLIYKTLGPDNIILVTDSMRQKGLGDGLSEIGGQKVIVKNSQARLESGALAGSVLKFNEGVRNISNINLLCMCKAFKMGSLNPAINLGISNKKGSIEVGKDADLVVIDKDYNVLKTYVGGKLVYEK